MERWKVIPGWPFYEISDHGNVRSWKPHPRSKSKRRDVPVKKVAPIIKRGYALLTLVEKNHTSERRLQSFYVHRLVAQEFVTGQRPGLDVAHLDGKRTNNHYSNLAWVTRSENMSHAIAHGTKTEGEKHGSTLLCDKGVTAILRLKAAGWDVGDIAWLFDMSPQSVCDYVAGRARFSVVGKRSRRTHLNSREGGVT